MLGSLPPRTQLIARFKEHLGLGSDIEAMVVYVCPVGSTVDGVKARVVNELAMTARVRGKSRMVCNIEGCEIKTHMVDDDLWEPTVSFL